MFFDNHKILTKNNKNTKLVKFPFSKRTLYEDIEKFKQNNPTVYLLIFNNNEILDKEDINENFIDLISNKMDKTNYQYIPNIKSKCEINDNIKQKIIDLYDIGRINPNVNEYQINQEVNLLENLLLYNKKNYKDFLVNLIQFNKKKYVIMEYIDKLKQMSHTIDKKSIKDLNTLLVGGNKTEVETLIDNAKPKIQTAYKYFKNQSELLKELEQENNQFKDFCKNAKNTEECIKELSTKIENFNNTEEQISELENEINELKKMNMVKDNMIKKQINDTQRDIENIRKQTKIDFDEAQLIHEDILEEKDEEIKKLKGYEEEHDKMKENLATYEANNITNALQIKNAQLEIDGLNESITENYNKYSEMYKDYLDVKNKLQLTLNEIEFLKEHNDNLKETETELRHKEMAYDELNNKYQKLLINLDEIQIIINQLETQHKETTAQLEKCEIHNKDDMIFLNTFKDLNLFNPNNLVDKSSDEIMEELIKVRKHINIYLATQEQNNMENVFNNNDDNKIIGEFALYIKELIDNLYNKYSRLPEYSKLKVNAETNTNNLLDLSNDNSIMSSTDNDNNNIIIEVNHGGKPTAKKKNLTQTGGVNVDIIEKRKEIFNRIFNVDCKYKYYDKEYNILNNKYFLYDILEIKDQLDYVLFNSYSDISDNIGKINYVSHPIDEKIIYENNEKIPIENSLMFIFNITNNIDINHILNDYYTNLKKKWKETQSSTTNTNNIIYLDDMDKKQKINFLNNNYLDINLLIQEFINTYGTYPLIKDLVKVYNDSIIYDKFIDMTLKSEPKKKDKKKESTKKEPRKKETEEDEEGEFNGGTNEMNNLTDLYIGGDQSETQQTTQDSAQNETKNQPSTQSVPVYFDEGSAARSKSEYIKNLTYKIQKRHPIYDLQMNQLYNKYLESNNNKLFIIIQLIYLATRYKCLIDNIDITDNDDVGEDNNKKLKELLEYIKEGKFQLNSNFIPLQNTSDNVYNFTKLVEIEQEFVQNILDDKINNMSLQQILKDRIDLNIEQGDPPIYEKYNNLSKKLVTYLLEKATNIISTDSINNEPNSITFQDIFIITECFIYIFWVINLKSYDNNKQYEYANKLINIDEPLIINSFTVSSILSNIYNIEFIYNNLYSGNVVNIINKFKMYIKAYIYKKEDIYDIDINNTILNSTLSNNFIDNLTQIYNNSILCFSHNNEYSIKFVDHDIKNDIEKNTKNIIKKLNNNSINSYDFIDEYIYINLGRTDDNIYRLVTNFDLNKVLIDKYCILYKKLKFLSFIKYINNNNNKFIDDINENILVDQYKYINYKYLITKLKKKFNSNYKYIFVYINLLELLLKYCITNKVEYNINIYKLLYHITYLYNTLYIQQNIDANNMNNILEIDKFEFNNITELNNIINSIYNINFINDQDNLYNIYMTDYSDNTHDPCSLLKLQNKFNIKLNTELSNICRVIKGGTTSQFISLNKSTSIETILNIVYNNTKSNKITLTYDSLLKIIGLLNYKINNEGKNNEITDALVNLNNNVNILKPFFKVDLNNFIELFKSWSEKLSIKSQLKTVEFYINQLEPEITNKNIITNYNILVNIYTFFKDKDYLKLAEDEITTKEILNDSKEQDNKVSTLIFKIDEYFKLLNKFESTIITPYKFKDNKLISILFDNKLVFKSFIKQSDIISSNNTKLLFDLINKSQNDYFEKIKMIIDNINSITGNEIKLFNDIKHLNFKQNFKLENDLILQRINIKDLFIREEILQIYLLNSIHTECKYMVDYFYTLINLQTSIGSLVNKSTGGYLQNFNKVGGDLAPTINDLLQYNNNNTLQELLSEFKESENITDNSIKFKKFILYIYLLHTLGNIDDTAISLDKIETLYYTLYNYNEELDDNNLEYSIYNLYKYKDLDEFYNKFKTAPDNESMTFKFYMLNTRNEGNKLLVRNDTEYMIMYKNLYDYKLSKNIITRLHNIYSYIPGIIERLKYLEIMFTFDNLIDQLKDLYSLIDLIRIQLINIFINSNSTINISNIENTWEIIKFIYNWFHDYNTKNVDECDRLLAEKMHHGYSISEIFDKIKTSYKKAFKHVNKTIGGGGDDSDTKTKLIMVLWNICKELYKQHDENDELEEYIITIYKICRKIFNYSERYNDNDNLDKIHEKINNSYNTFNSDESKESDGIVRLKNNLKKNLTELENMEIDLRIMDTDEDTLIDFSEELEKLLLGAKDENKNDYIKCYFYILNSELLIEEYGHSDELKKMLKKFTTNDDETTGKMKDNIKEYLKKNKYKHKFSHNYLNPNPAIKGFQAYWKSEKPGDLNKFFEDMIDIDPNDEFLNDIYKIKEIDNEEIEEEINSNKENIKNYLEEQKIMSLEGDSDLSTLKKEKQQITDNHKTITKIHTNLTSGDSNLTGGDSKPLITGGKPPFIIEWWYKVIYNIIKKEKETKYNSDADKTGLSKLPHYNTIENEEGNEEEINEFISTIDTDRDLISIVLDILDVDTISEDIKFDYLNILGNYLYTIDNTEHILYSKILHYIPSMIYHDELINNIDKFNLSIDINKPFNNQQYEYLVTELNKNINELRKIDNEKLYKYISKYNYLKEKPSDSNIDKIITKYKYYLVINNKVNLNNKINLLKFKIGKFSHEIKIIEYVYNNNLIDEYKDIISNEVKFYNFINLRNELDKMTGGSLNNSDKKIKELYKFIILHNNINYIVSYSNDPSIKQYIDDYYKQKIQILLIDGHYAYNRMLLYKKIENNTDTDTDTETEDIQNQNEYDISMFKYKKDMIKDYLIYIYANIALSDSDYYKSLDIWNNDKLIVNYNNIINNKNIITDLDSSNEYVIKLRNLITEVCNNSDSINIVRFYLLITGVMYFYAIELIQIDVNELISMLRLYNENFIIDLIHTIKSAIRKGVVTNIYGIKYEQEDKEKWNEKIKQLRGDIDINTEDEDDDINTDDGDAVADDAVADDAAADDATDDDATDDDATDDDDDDDDEDNIKKIMDIDDKIDNYRRMLDYITRTWNALNTWPAILDEDNVELRKKWFGIAEIERPVDHHVDPVLVESNKYYKTWPNFTKYYENTSYNYTEKYDGGVENNTDKQTDAFNRIKGDEDKLRLITIFPKYSPPPDTPHKVKYDKGLDTDPHPGHPPHPPFKSKYNNIGVDNDNTVFIDSNKYYSSIKLGVKDPNVEMSEEDFKKYNKFGIIIKDDANKTQFGYNDTVPNNTIRFKANFKLVPLVGGAPPGTPFYPILGYPSPLSHLGAPLSPHYMVPPVPPPVPPPVVPLLPPVPPPVPPPVVPLLPPVPLGAGATAPPPAAAAPAAAAAAPAAAAAAPAAAAGRGKRTAPPPAAAAGRGKGTAPPPGAGAAPLPGPPEDYIKINKIKEVTDKYDEFDLLLDTNKTHPDELKKIRYITKEDLKADDKCENFEDVLPIDDSDNFYSLIKAKRDEFDSISNTELNDDEGYIVEFNKLLGIDEDHLLIDKYPKNKKEEYISYKYIYELKHNKTKEDKKNMYIDAIKNLIEKNKDKRDTLLYKTGGNYPIYKYTKPNFNNYEVNNIIDLFNLVKVDNIFNNKKDNEKLIYDAKILLDNNFNKFENLNPINENILDIRENIDDVYGIIINSYKKQQLIKELIDKKNKLSDEFENNCKLLIEYSEI